MRKASWTRERKKKTRSVHEITQLQWSMGYEEGWILKFAEIGKDQRNDM